MDNFESKYLKDQTKAKEEATKSTWTMSYRIKGLTMGAFLMFAYLHFYLDKDDPKMIVAGGVLGYFFGWLAGNFFYTKK